MTPEKEIQNAIINYFTLLRNSGFDNYVERRQAGGFAYKMGLPDLWAIIFGKHIEIEVKAPGKQARATQEKWAKRFKQMGVEYICTDNANDVVELVHSIGIEYFEKRRNKNE